MKELVKNYIDHDVSRRDFITALAGIGLSSAASRAVAEDFRPFVTRPGDEAALPQWAQRASGTGGSLLLEQLAAAGHEYLFVNPSSGEAPIFDALVDRSDLTIIKAVHEGPLTAMADGYARASGKTPFVLCSRPGLPNAMTQMFNTWKDYIPMLVMVDDVDTGSLGQDGFEAMDHMSSMTEPMVKWHWEVETTAKLPEVIRRGLKFAATEPRGPVFISCPENLLDETADSLIYGRDKFDVPMRLHPDPDQIRAAAEWLIAADNPLILAGNEVRYHGAERELVELAELLGAPVVKGFVTTWCKPFPTDHPLNLENYQPNFRFPGKVDVMLNVGARMSYFTSSMLKIEPQVKLIQIRMDATNVARVYPTELAMVANTKFALQELIEEIRGMAGARQLRRVASARTDRALRHRAERVATLENIARKRWDNAPISGERLAMELESHLPKDSIIVSENDTYQTMLDNYITYGPEAKDYYTNGGAALGWGLPAAFGIKLALPDRPVVAVISDGGFLFSGPQPLWSYARYHAPVTVIVMNNRSYNNERNRIVQGRGRMYQTGRDMVCYLGDPDIDYVKLAAGFGVEAETVREPATIKAALQRAQAATAEGRPYLIDLHAERRGSMANSTWHPEYSLAAMRSRPV